MNDETEIVTNELSSTDDVLKYIRDIKYDLDDCLSSFPGLYFYVADAVKPFMKETELDLSDIHRMTDNLPNDITELSQEIKRSNEFATAELNDVSNDLVDRINDLAHTLSADINNISRELDSFQMDFERHSHSYDELQDLPSTITDTSTGEGTLMSAVLELSAKVDVILERLDSLARA
jgi:uncharacterized phage infection (PIP) family protein YhgE